MSNEQTSGKAKRDRSPSYPSIPLGTAIDRLAAFDEYFKRHPAPVKSIGNAWGIKPLSSQAASILAALKSYGLVDYQGSGKDMKAVLSESGRTYLRAQQEEIKKQVLRILAVKPKAMARYFNEWGPDRPPNEVCLDELVLNAKFSQAGAENFLKVYDSTIAFAGLSSSGKIEEGDGGDPDIDSGDYQEDESEPRLAPRRNVRKPEVGMRQDVFSVEEGAVTIEWPAALSAASLQDIEDWLTIVKRKISRSLKGMEKPDADEQEQ